MASSESVASDHGIQLLSLDNHKFQLRADEFKLILENENIRDRYVSIISIAGAKRNGKSFLLNFFLKYLNAKVTSDCSYYVFQ